MRPERLLNRAEFTSRRHDHSNKSRPGQPLTCRNSVVNGNGDVALTLRSDGG
jgi:hypothetical protein